MTRLNAASRMFTAAAICLAAAGCLTQEAFDGIGAELDRQFEQKTAEIDEVINNIGAGITASADRAQKEYEDFRDRLIGSYEQAQKPPEPVFFGEDGKPVARPAPPTPDTAGKEAIPFKPAPPPEIHSEFLSERTLEHRGLRLLWKLALDGSGARHTDINGGHLYVTTKLNRMYSIELKTGLTRWVVGLSGKPDGPPGFNADYVVISAGDTIHVVEKAVGKDKWRFETDIQPSSRPYCDAEGFTFGCWDGSVCGFAFGERYPRWRFKARDRVFAAPYCRGGYAFAAADDGTCSRYHASERLSAGDTSLGGRPVGDLLGTPDLIYIGTENFEMIALKEGDGTVVWRHGCGGRVLEGPWLSGDGNVLLYSARDDGLYTLTAATGKERWRIVDGVRPVAVVGTHLMVLRSDGTVCKADAGTGQVLWSESIAPFATAVGHMANEVLYLVSADGQVFAVAPKK